ncbi:MAG: hypothetical protein EAX96_13965 [Candidatus Lokiarchaeota archaeon]|nr:hypothetical protein [Candidatus Lokiarchaeota archaeon]
MTKGKKSAKNPKKNTEIEINIEEKVQKGEVLDASLMNLNQQINQELTLIKRQYNKLEKALMEKDELISTLKKQSEEQMDLINNLQTSSKTPLKEEKVDLDLLIEKFSKSEKSKDDKVREGLRTISGILMGLSFHLYFMLYDIPRFTISALLLFSAFCFFMSVVFTFVAHEKWTNFPTYLLITGAISLVINSNFLFLVRFEAGLATNITDNIIIWSMFPAVLALIGIYYAIQEEISRTRKGFKKKMEKFFEQ